MSRRIIVLVVVLTIAAVVFLFFAPVVPYRQLQYVQAGSSGGTCIPISSGGCTFPTSKQVWISSYGSFAYEAFGIGSSPFSFPVRITVNGTTTVFVFNSTGFVVEEQAFPSDVKSEPIPLISVGAVKAQTIPFGGTGVSLELVNNGLDENATVVVESPSSSFYNPQTINAGQSAAYNLTSWAGPLPRAGDSLRLTIYANVCFGHEGCFTYESNVVSKVEASSGVTGPPQFIASGVTGPVYLVGAMSTDPSALPNMGVRSTIQVVNAQTSGSLSFWISDGLSNNVWGQVGYFINKGSLPVGFYQVWNLTSNNIVARGTTSIGNGAHTFSMYVQNGMTWAYAIDGVVFGTYDMGANSSSLTYPVYTLSEQQGSSFVTFPSVIFINVMQVFRSGSWNPVVMAVSYGAGWFVWGNLQNNNLGADEMIVGSTLPNGFFSPAQQGPFCGTPTPALDLRFSDLPLCVWIGMETWLGIRQSPTS